MEKEDKETDTAGLSQQNALEDVNGSFWVSVYGLGMLFYGSGKGGPDHSGNPAVCRAVDRLDFHDDICGARVGLLRMPEIFSRAEAEKPDCPDCRICGHGGAASVCCGIFQHGKRYAVCVNVCWQHTKN